MPSLRPLKRMFSGDKTLESPVLNRMGAQVIRAVMARTLYNARRTAADEAIRDHVETLSRDGMLMIPNFLGEEQFENVRREAALMLEGPNKIHLQHGPNRMEQVVIDEARRTACPSIAEFYDDPRLVGIMSGVEKRQLDATSGSRALEYLIQGPAGGHDPESDLHSDIFFNTHKAWLYLRDVDTEIGPLVFVKGSHRLSLGQLGYLYQESVSRAKGSRRITPDELERLGLEETVLVCKANTLVIANTCGYHRRLRGEPGRERLALHWSVRLNPFRFG